MKNINRRHVLLSTILYIFVFYYAYLTFLYPYFGYAGFEYREKDILETIIVFFFAFIPCLFYREGEISSFISIFIYILLYIPIVFSFFFIPTFIETRDYLLQISFLFGMILFFKVGSFETRSYLELPALLFDKKVILFLSIFFIIIIAIIYRDNIQFVSFEEVYDLREANNKITSQSNFLAYLKVWMSNFFMPICLAYGIVYKNRIYFLIGSLIALVLYMTTGAKIAILFPFAYLFFNYLSKRNIIEKFYSYLVYSIAGLISLCLLLLELFPSNDTIFLINSVLISRTIGNGGLLTFWYDDFFQNNPYTYYSHINFVNLISQSYPYDRELGFLIGGAYWHEKMNANANFWATDGIAAMGILGTFLANIIMAVVLFLLDFVSKNKDKLFIILIFLPFISMFLNTSVFTALLSGGAFLSIMFILNFKQ